MSLITEEKNITEITFTERKIIDSKIKKSKERLGSSLKFEGRKIRQLADDLYDAARKIFHAWHVEDLNLSDEDVITTLEEILFYLLVIKDHVNCYEVSTRSIIQEFQKELNQRKVQEK